MIQFPQEKTETKWGVVAPWSNRISNSFVSHMGNDNRWTTAFGRSIRNGLSRVIFKTLVDFTVPALLSESKIPLYACLSVHFSVSAHLIFKQECAICESADGVCVMFLLSSDVRAKQGKGGGKTTLLPLLLMHPSSPPSSGSDVQPFTSVPFTVFAGTACVISVTDRKTGSLIRLHLGFFFSSGRVLVNHRNPDILHGFHLWNQ